MYGSIAATTLMTLTRVALFLLIAVPPLAAQSSPAPNQQTMAVVEVTGLTPAQIAARLRDVLFEGINLDSTRAERAMNIIMKQREADSQLDRADPELTQKRSSLLNQRNTELVGLLITPADRDRFFHNAGRQILFAVRPK